MREKHRNWNVNLFLFVFMASASKTAANRTRYIWDCVSAFQPFSDCRSVPAYATLCNDKLFTRNVFNALLRICTNDLKWWNICSGRNKINCIHVIQHRTHEFRGEQKWECVHSSLLANAISGHKQRACSQSFFFFFFVARDNS